MNRKKIHNQYLRAKNENPNCLGLSGIFLMFKVELFENGTKCIAENGIYYNELKRDHFTMNSYLEPTHAQEVLERNSIEMSGTSGIYFGNKDISSNNAYTHQRTVAIHNKYDVLPAVRGY